MKTMRLLQAMETIIGRKGNVTPMNGVLALRESENPKLNTMMSYKVNPKRTFGNDGELGLHFCTIVQEESSCPRA